MTTKFLNYHHRPFFAFFLPLAGLGTGWVSPKFRLGETSRGFFVFFSTTVVATSGVVMASQ
jgi:hypothetical protein